MWSTRITHTPFAPDRKVRYDYQCSAGCGTFESREIVGTQSCSCPSCGREARKVFVTMPAVLKPKHFGDVHQPTYRELNEDPTHTKKIW